MRRQLSVRQQVIVSYTILVLLIVAAGLLTLRPSIVERMSFFDRLGVLREVHAKSQTVLNTALARQQAGPDSKPPRDEKFFRGETPALAAAALQNYIEQIIEGRGALLVSLEFQESDQSFAPTPISVVVRARSSILAFEQILLDLESEEPLLFIEELSIQSQHRPGRVLKEINEELDVNVRVKGFWNQDPVQ
jgi:hypothetical protein